ncbi:MAG: PAS domain S-box protein [Candidatus Thorarchaeota archaeon]
MSDDKGTNSVGTRKEGTSTEQPQHEELLRARNYLDLVEVIFVGLDTKGVVVFANRKCCKVLGYDHDEAIGKDWFKTFVPKKVRKETYDIFRSLMKGKTELVEYFENPILTKDGEERIIAWHNTLLTDEAGSITGTLSSGEDITESKRAEETLRESEERYRVLVESMNDGMGAVDEDKRFTFVNNYFAKMLGYTPEEMIGQPIADFIDRDNLNTLTENMEKRKEGLPSAYELTWTTKTGGEVISIVSGSSLLDRNGIYRGSFAVITDITERKRLEEQIRSERDRLQSLMDGLSLTGIGLDVVDVDYRILSQNLILRERFGECIGTLCYETYMGYEKPCDDCPMENAIETGNVQRVVLTGSDGRNYEISSAPFVNPDGTVDKVIEIVRDITERKRTEEALRESEEKYRTILENIEDGYYEVDLSGSFTFHNKSLCRILGYSKEELVGMNYRNYTMDDHTESVYQTFNKVYRTKKPTEVFDWEIIRKDGRRRPIEASVSLIVDSIGEPIGFRGIIRDITERKRAQDKLHESEERYRVLVETMNDGLGIIDRKRRFTFVNICFAEMLGYSPEEMIGQPITDFIDKDNLNILTENIGKRKEGLPSAYELAWTTKTGGEVVSIVSGSSLVDKDGAHLGSFAIITDITERKRSEKALQESEQRYRELIDMLPQGVVAADLNEKIDLVNKEMCNILGYGSEELTGRSLVDFVDVRDAKKMTTQTARRTQGVFSSYDLRMIHKTGETRDVQVSAAPVRNNAGEIDKSIGVFMDITESKRNAEQRRQQHSELEVYASLIRHDLRNDVGIILGNVDLAKMIAGENDSEILQTLSSTEAACERMTNLLKAVSGPADTIEKNIVALVSSVSAQAQDAHTKLTVNVTVNDDAEELTIVGNRLLPMVFENLLRNAASHTGEKPVVDMVISKEGNNVQVLVSDNGPGIPEKVRNRLFHRGASTSGGGLGLYLSREIVNAMNGLIELMDTDPGEGATFKILLPLTM